MNQRKKRPVETRQAILAAAGAGFSAQGYAATGLGTIVEQAGLTKGALFHHFKDKQSLALAWISGDLAAAISATWVDGLQGIGSLDALKSWCRARCLEIRAGDAASALVLLAAETAHSDSALREAFERVFSEWRGAFAAVIERGRTAGWIHRSIQPAVEAAFLVSAISGLTVTSKSNPEESARRTCATALEGYLETLRSQ